jgi:non-homologous end joining protein Ku
MARPNWYGTLSFGLLNIPVSLMSGERRIDLYFRILDGRHTLGCFEQCGCTAKATKISR